MVIDKQIPKQVEKVYEMLVANAKEARELDDSVYLGYCAPEDWQKEPHEEWVIGDNYERGSFTLIYRPDLDKWFYRSKWSGEDRSVFGGFSEVMSNVECWYTG